jgi:hypothetical protein
LQFSKRIEKKRKEKKRSTEIEKGRNKEIGKGPFSCNFFFQIQGGSKNYWIEGMGQ